MATKIPKDETPSTHDRKRMLLDTNIWRYVIDSQAQGSLMRLARDSLYQVQIAPGVLYEALRVRDATLRAALVRLMTNSRFYRLMPEAYSESMEILREIERARPDWLRDEPDLLVFKRFKKDWARKTGTKGFWARCERSPQTEAHYVSVLEEGRMEVARTDAHVSRKEMIEAKWTSMPPMDTMLAGFEAPLPGWRGDFVEAWRVDGFLPMTYALSRKDHAYRDWITPFVELDNGILRSGDWVEFWLYLTDKSALPRQWLQWAIPSLRVFGRLLKVRPVTRSSSRILSRPTS